MYIWCNNIIQKCGFKVDTLNEETSHKAAKILKMKKKLHRHVFDISYTKKKPGNFQVFIIESRQEGQET